MALIVNRKINIKPWSDNALSVCIVFTVHKWHGQGIPTYVRYALKRYNLCAIAWTQLSTRMAATCRLTVLRFRRLCAWSFLTLISAHPWLLASTTTLPAVLDHPFWSDDSLKSTGQVHNSSQSVRFSLHKCAMYLYEWSAHMCLFRYYWLLSWYFLQQMVYGHPHAVNVKICTVTKELIRTFYCQCIKCIVW